MNGAPPHRINCNVEVLLCFRFIMKMKYAEKPISKKKDSITG